MIMIALLMLLQGPGWVYEYLMIVVAPLLCSPPTALYLVSNTDPCSLRRPASQHPQNLNCICQWNSKLQFRLFMNILRPREIVFQVLPLRRDSPGPLQPLGGQIYNRGAQLDSWNIISKESAKIARVPLPHKLFYSICFSLQNYETTAHL